MDSSLVSLLTNFGALGVVVVLIILGFLVPKPTVAKLEQEITKLREALALERKLSDDATAAGEVTRQLLSALTSLATERQPAAHPPAPPVITGKDTGL